MIPGRTNTYHGLLLNPQSVNNKVGVIHEAMISDNVDIACITETWIKPDDPISQAAFCLQDFILHSISRENKRGGGLAFLVKKGIKHKFEVGPKNLLSMEICYLHILDPIKLITMALIYRKEEIAFLTFLHELESIFETNINQKSDLILMGDFNIKMNRANDDHAEYLRDFMDSVDYKNLIQFPTHRSGNTIDLILTAVESKVVCRAQGGEFFSDHAAVKFDCVCSKEAQILETKEVRSYRKIDKADLHNRLTSVVESWGRTVELKAPIQSLVKSYSDGILEIIDDLAPVKVITVKPKPMQSWINDDLVNPLKK